MSRKTNETLKNPDLKKAKLLNALRDIDEGIPSLLFDNCAIERKGHVRSRVFFNLLECMDFRLTEDTKTQIVQEYSNSGEKS